MPQPTSKPGQPGGNQGPTRPTNFPLDFSSTTNMPAPCSAQCPAITAALRHPANSLLGGLPSAAMNRAVPGSDSIAALGATSAPHHCRSLRRSVSITRPFGWASVTPALSGGNIGFRPHNYLASMEVLTAVIVNSASDGEMIYRRWDGAGQLLLRYQRKSWRPHELDAHQRSGARRSQI